MTNRTGPIARTVLAAQSDERLVRLLRDGHQQAFDEIVRRYRGPLVGFATAIVNHDRAEDVVQSALEKAHGALLADEREINLRPWLFTIVRNGSLNLIRSEPVTDELDPLLSATPGAGPEQIAERNEEMSRLFTAICALPNAQREALVRRELEGVGHGEIASQLGTTSTAVRGLIFRARTQLRNAVGALVPLPLLRTLLAQGSAAGVAGGGAGVALFGSAGAKGGAAVAAAVLAIGAGIAVEKRQHGDHGDIAVAEAAENGSGTAGRPGARSASPASSRPAGTTSGRDEQTSGERDGGPRNGANDPSHGGDAGAGSQNSPGSSGSSGSSGSGSGSGSGGHDDSSGSGSGDDGGSDGPESEPPEQVDDNSGTGSDSSGSDDHESSDHEDAPDPPEPPEVEEPENDSSGPGDGSDDSEAGGTSDDGS